MHIAGRGGREKEYTCGRVKGWERWRLRWVRAIGRYKVWGSREGTREREKRRGEVKGAITYIYGLEFCVIPYILFCSLLLALLQSSLGICRGSVLGPATDTKTWGCSCPIVGPPYLHSTSVDSTSHGLCSTVVFIEKNLCIRGAAQFKFLLFKGHL